MLNPTYSKEQIEHLDKNEKMVRAYDSTLYLPGKSSKNVNSEIRSSFSAFSGIVGLNNIKDNDYCNVILQVTFFIRVMHFHSDDRLGFGECRSLARLFSSRR